MERLARFIHQRGFVVEKGKIRKKGLRDIREKSNIISCEAMKQAETRGQIMLTLALCTSTFGYLIQETNKDGVLTGLFYPTGESCGIYGTEWEVITVVGEQADDDDWDAFWHAIDESVCFLARNKGKREAWELWKEAHEGMLGPRDLAQGFREFMREISP